MSSGSQCHLKLRLCGSTGLSSTWHRQISLPYAVRWKGLMLVEIIALIEFASGQLSGSLFCFDLFSS